MWKGNVWDLCLRRRFLTEKWKSGLLYLQCWSLVFPHKGMTLNFGSWIRLTRFQSSLLWLLSKRRRVLEDMYFQIWDGVKLFRWIIALNIINTMDKVQGRFPSLCIPPQRVSCVIKVRSLSQNCCFTVSLLKRCETSLTRCLVCT